MEVAQRAKPTKIVHVGAVLGIPETLPAAGAADRPQFIYTQTREVSFTEEPDVGNPQVRFCEGR